MSNQDYVESICADSRRDVRLKCSPASRISGTREPDARERENGRGMREESLRLVGGNLGCNSGGAQCRVVVFHVVPPLFWDTHVNVPLRFARAILNKRRFPMEPPSILQIWPGEFFFSFYRDFRLALSADIERTFNFTGDIWGYMHVELYVEFRGELGIV